MEKAIVQPTNEESVTTVAAKQVTRIEEVELAIKEFNLNSSAVVLLDLCSITSDPEGLQRELIQRLQTEEFKTNGDCSAFTQYARERVLNQFSVEHSLSEACLSFLQLLTIEVLADVLTSFSPGDEDFNVALMNYAAEKKASGFKDVEKKVQKDYIAPEVLTFTRQWSLNDTSIKLLQSLPHEIINDVMFNFHPRDVSRDVNPVFGSFVKSRMFPRPVYSTDYAPRVKSKFSSGPTQWQWDYSHIAWNNSFAIESFVRQWNLNESAVHLLNSLPPETFYDVITYFNPKDTTRDVNAIFLAFARSRANANMFSDSTWTVPPISQLPLSPLSIYGDMPSPSLNYNDVDLFASYWGLNANASKLVKQLPYDQQCEVMQNFCPKDVTRDVNPVFIAFAKSRIAQREMRKGGGF